MQPFIVRWQNFRGFSDTSWLEMRPLTVVVGANASGKTSLIAPLLLLKQTLDSTDHALALKTQGELFNAGSFRNLIFAHNTELRLTFQFKFHEPPGPAEERGDVGDYPPGWLELGFDFDGAEAAPRLAAFVVRDDFGRVMLSRKRLESGRFSLRKLPKRLQREDFAGPIRASQPHHFLFDVEDVFRRIYVRERRSGSRRHENTEALLIEAGKSAQLYFSIVSHIGDHIRTLFHRLAYLGPLRARPKRLYEISGEKPLNVGTRGENAPEILFRQQDDLLVRVNEWISRFDFGLHLLCESATEGAFSINVQRAKGSPTINLADTGFGLSQILPLIVQGLHSRRGLVIAEQPEIHLNPRLQARLADLFTAITNRGNTVLVETHSEHLVLRLRRLIAEKLIKAEDVALYFSEREGDTSTLRRIPVKPNGHIESVDWPRGFFEESLAESLALATAQMRTPNA